MSTLKTCRYCLKYKDSPIWGHSHCSMHRKCMGRDSWAPEQCDECINSKEVFSQLSPEEKEVNRGELLKLLEKSNTFKSQKDINWSYEDKIETFLTGQVENPEDDVTPYNSEEEFDENSGDDEPSHDNRDEVIRDLSQRYENMEDLLRSLLDGKQPSHPNIEYFPYSPNRPSTSDNTGAESYFCEGGDTYIFFDPHIHTMIGDNKVKMGSNVMDVKWHHEHHRAFVQIKKHISKRSPYVDPEVGHQNLMSLLKLNPCSSDSPIGKRKGFVTSLDEESGLALTLREVKDCEKDILRDLIEGNKDKLRKHFKDDAFKTVSMANLTSGWSMTNSEYIEWAKLQPLDLTDISDTLGFSLNFVKKDLLDAEKFSRCELVDFLTGMCLMENLQKLVRKDINTYNVSLAISRHFMPTLKNLLINWMKTKVEIRKVILNGFSSTTAKQLLRSSLWDPDIFPKAELERIKLNGPDKNIGYLLKSYPRWDNLFLTNKNFVQQDYQRQRKRKNFGPYRPFSRDDGSYRRAGAEEPPRKKLSREEKGNSHITTTFGESSTSAKKDSPRQPTERQKNKKSGFQSRKNNQNTKNKGIQGHSKK